MARKKGYFRMGHTIYHICTEKMNRHLRNKRKDNDLIDLYVPLFNCHFRPLVSNWGMQGSKFNSRFETKARRSVSSVAQMKRKAAVQKTYQISSYFL